MGRAGKKQKYRVMKRRRMCSNSRFDVFFDTVEDGGGNVTDDFLIVRPKVSATHMLGAVVGICVLPEVCGRIGLMRGYRHHLGCEVWQAPAGFVEETETPLDTALRELEEEASFTCRSEELVSLGVFFPDAGLIEGRVGLYVARNVRLLEKRGIAQHEVGTGELRFFDRRELAALVGSSTVIGG